MDNSLYGPGNTGQALETSEPRDEDERSTSSQQSTMERIKESWSNKTPKEKRKWKAGSAVAGLVIASGAIAISSESEPEDTAQEATSEVPAETDAGLDATEETEEITDRAEEPVESIIEREQVLRSDIPPELYEHDIEIERQIQAHFRGTSDQRFTMWRGVVWAEIPLEEPRGDAPYGAIFLRLENPISISVENANEDGETLVYWTAFDPDTERFMSYAYGYEIDGQVKTRAPEEGIYRTTSTVDSPHSGQIVEAVPRSLSSDGLSVRDYYAELLRDDSDSLLSRGYIYYDRNDVMDGVERSFSYSDDADAISRDFQILRDLNTQE